MLLPPLMGELGIAHEHIPPIGLGQDRDLDQAVHIVMGERQHCGLNALAPPGIALSIDLRELDGLEKIDNFRHPAGIVCDDITLKARTERTFRHAVILVEQRRDLLTGPDMAASSCASPTR